MSSLGSSTWRYAAGRRALLTAGLTDPGSHREVNEDRFYLDPTRGLFAVIDGVGGQAAGGRAADIALAMMRERLERETGPVADRIREAIVVANNEICRLASTRAEWRGMACVLTVAVVTDGKATIGHVGDTRLYKVQDGHIQKITRDHSPVGEREDAGELSELQAMRHPRRNEVYRDVGSELHEPGDADFVDVDEVAFEPDAALLLCTDGLTDLVDSAAISRVIAERAGDPEGVVASLIDAANAAGGKDNVTVVYVEGERFAKSRTTSPIAPRRVTAGEPARVFTGPAGTPGSRDTSDSRPPRARHPFVALALIALLVVATAGALMRAGYRVPLAWLDRDPAPTAPPAQATSVQTVRPAGSIAEAIARAEPDSEIIVEPGEYREQLVLRDRVRLVSRVPRAATIRLPAAVPDSATVPAVVASGLSRAGLAGFRIVGDAATPLAVGVRAENSAMSIVDVEITGATRAALEFSGAGVAELLGSDVRDNPGAAVIVQAGATPRIAHNVFARNGTSERTTGALVLMNGSAPRFSGNVFVGLGRDALARLDDAARLALQNENWFVSVSPRRTTRGPAPNGPQRSR